MKHTDTLWAERRVFYVRAGGTYSNHWGVKGIMVNILTPASLQLHVSSCNKDVKQRYILPPELRLAMPLITAKGTTFLSLIISVYS
jgi:hypothetical protein